MAGGSPPRGPSARAAKDPRGEALLGSILAGATRRAAAARRGAGGSMEGRLLGPYRLKSMLGAGGMGTVWKAVVEGPPPPGLRAGQAVAIKLIHHHLIARPGFLKRFLREAEIGREVRHENVVRTFDAAADESEGRKAPSLAMELLEGQTLRGLLSELVRLPEELCRHVGLEVAKALAAIHAAGIVHRD